MRLGSSDVPGLGARKAGITGIVTLSSGVGQHSGCRVNKSSAVAPPATSPHLRDSKRVNEEKTGLYLNDENTLV